MTSATTRPEQVSESQKQKTKSKKQRGTQQLQAEKEWGSEWEDLAAIGLRDLGVTTTHDNDDNTTRQTQTNAAAQ